MRIKITKVPKALNGLSVEDGKATPISKNMVMLGGDYHEDGGTMINYKGKQVEAEKGEPVSIGNSGEAVVWGNMNVPGTKKKFKTVAKELGEKENLYDIMNKKAENLLANNDYDDKYQRLSFNSGRLMQLGAAYGQKDVNMKKEQLADLQKALLQHADEHNLDPQALSQGKFKKAKNGIRIADDGDEIGGTRSDGNNNPGNIKYGKFAKSQGATGKDKDGFAIFPDRNKGTAAMKSLLTSKGYKDMDAHDAIYKWTGGNPYNYKLPQELQGKKISEMSDSQVGSLMNMMSQGEGTKYGGKSNPVSNPTSSPDISKNAPYIPYNYTEKNLPNIPLTPEDNTQTPVGATPPDVNEFSPVNKRPMPTNAQALNLGQIFPELATWATNHVEPVALQKYTPQLYVPYQMSFQDRLNQNQRTFNQQSRQLIADPSDVAGIGMNKYAADNQVRAEEFRTNQGIQADTINKNVQVNNDAQLKNLQLADQQYVRQAEAKARTEEINHMVLNSISGKYAQNNLNNQRLKAYENLYNYRFTPNDMGGMDATYFGPDAQFNYGGNKGAGQGQGQGNMVTVRDANGNVKYTRETDPSQLQQTGQSLLNQQRARQLSYMRSFYDMF
jgi:hypothetical protein